VKCGQGVYVSGSIFISLTGRQEVIMKKTRVVAIVAAVLMLAGAMSASAKFRMDIDVPWYVYVGLSPALEAELDAEFGTVNISQYAVVIPNIQAYFMFGGDMLKFGAGARVYTVLVMNFLYPSLVAELKLGKFDVNLNVGGLAGVLLGLGPTFQTATGPWFTMDLSAGYRLTDWFRIGAGAFAFAHTDYPEYFPYAIYVSGKFILNAK
jgi:hypothetical protein